LLTGKPVRTLMAMTGEITLSGNVLRWAASRRKCWPPNAPVCMT